MDGAREAVVAVHQTNWRLLQGAAESYLNDFNHAGFLIAGKFHRGPQRGGGQYVGSYERDRSRALQLLAEGLGRSQADADRGGGAGYLLTLAHALMGNRAMGEPWRLQSKTPLDVLADYDQNPYAYWGGGEQAGGAPVGPDGGPVYYRVPASFETAENDGERWRWALNQAALANPGLLNTTRTDLASFCISQFGAQTIAGTPFGNGRAEGPARRGEPLRARHAPGRRSDRPAGYWNQAVQAS